MDGLSHSAPRFSLIIPAYNEEAYLPAVLNSVDAARECYAGGPDEIEVVVVDNCSTDATADLARSSGCRVVREEKRIIAAVRNTGARSANGQILVFVDADNIMHSDTFNAIDKSLATGKVIAGATGVKMQRMSVGIAITYALMVPLVWLTRMDTGVVFCRRKDFETIGGYNEKMLFAEDVMLLWDLMRLGCKRGQRLTRITSVRAIFSTRKFDKYGDWHYLWMPLRLLFGLLTRKSAVRKFAQMYWYGNQRSKSEKEMIAVDKSRSQIGFKLMSWTFRVRDFIRPRMDLLAEAGIEPGFRVLDYGCGPGSYTAPLAQLVGTSGEIYALDILPLATKEVQKIADQNAFANIKTIVSDCKTGLPDNHVDVVLLYDTFHDLSQPDDVLHELHRVLKLGGTLSFSDHHMKDQEIIMHVTKTGLFKLSKKGKKTYSFSKCA